jgi:circadian clock protein KaiB
LNYCSKDAVYSASNLDESLNGSKNEIYVLKLYVTGMTTRSINAVENIKQIVEEKLPGCYELEVIDIYQHPELAKNEHIIATPTLIKKFPLPMQNIIGDMSDKKRVILDLDLIPKPK